MSDGETRQAFLRTLRAVSERVYESDCPERTEAIAGELAAALRGGEVVALHGDLGAGKTRFVRGLVRGLGGSERAVPGDSP